VLPGCGQRRKARAQRLSGNLDAGPVYNRKPMDTLARIKQLAAKEFSINPDGLDPNAPLDSLGIDSLSFIEFMFKVEEEFGVSVSDEELKGIKTLADLERHVASALAATGKA
jgi:acyl carrier protein